VEQAPVSKAPASSDALGVFTGVSGSGQSSLALETLYAGAQRRYLESVAPYVRCTRRALERMIPTRIGVVKSSAT
jgi:excinuclease UvrABC ATPase subunit